MPAAIVAAFTTLVPGSFGFALATAAPAGLTPAPTVHFAAWPRQSKTRAELVQLMGVADTTAAVGDAATRIITAIADYVDKHGPDNDDGLAAEFATLIEAPVDGLQRVPISGRCLAPLLVEGNVAFSRKDLPVTPGDFVVVAMKGMPLPAGKIFLGWHPAMGDRREPHAAFLLLDPHIIMLVPLRNVVHIERITEVERCGLREAATGAAWALSAGVRRFMANLSPKLLAVPQRGCVGEAMGVIAVDIAGVMRAVG